MAGYDATYKGLQEMILRDQFFSDFRQVTRFFWKEKRKLSLNEITQKSNHYFEAHRYSTENHEKKTNGSNNKTYTSYTHN